MRYGYVNSLLRMYLQVRKRELWSMGADVLRVNKFSSLICHYPELKKRKNRIYLLKTVSKVNIVKVILCFRQLR